MSSDSHWIAARLSKKLPTASKNAENESPSDASGTRLAWQADVHAAPRHGRGLDDRRRRLAEDHEAVDELLQVLDVAHRRLHEEAVLAGDAVALHDLRRRARELGHLGDLTRRGPDADDRGERVAERPRVDLGVVAGDRAVALEPLHALGDGRRRQADAAPQLGEAEPAVELELFEDSTVGHVVRPLNLKHRPQDTCEWPFEPARWRSILSAWIRRPRSTSSAARSSTTSGRRSRCCCSHASRCSASRGCGSPPRPSCSWPGGGRGGCCGYGGGAGGWLPGGAARRGRSPPFFLRSTRVRAAPPPRARCFRGFGPAPP